MNFSLFIVCDFSFFLLCSLLSFIVVHYARDCSCGVRACNRGNVCLCLIRLNTYYLYVFFGMHSSSTNALPT